MKVYSHPTPDAAALAFFKAPGGPMHGVLARAKWLRRLGVETVADRRQADLTHVTGVDMLAGTDVQTINYIWPAGLVADAPAWWREQNAAMAQAMQAARAVVVNSAYMADLAQRLCGVEARVVAQAIDPEEWQGVDAGDWRNLLDAGDRPVVLWGKNTVGPLRNPAPAVGLAELWPDALVVLTAEYDDVAAFLGRDLPDNVCCVGVLPFPRMQRLLAACDVYLATMLESSGQGHLEAMYLGKPVIGYAWGGVGELAAGVAVLAHPHDVADLGACLGAALTQRERLGAAGRRLVESRHLWLDAAAQYKQIYEELLS